MTKNTNQNTNKPTYYELSEIEEALGVSRRTLYRWIQSGELKADRWGQRWRVSDVQLAEFSEFSKQKYKRGAAPLVQAASPPVQQKETKPAPSGGGMTNSEKRAQGRNRKGRK